MKYEVLVQPPALEDIESAYQWLAKQTPTLCGPTSYADLWDYFVVTFMG